jgi:hypothetical protein
LKVAVKKSLPSSPWGTREVAPIVIVSCWSTFITRSLHYCPCQPK